MRPTAYGNGGCAGFIKPSIRVLFYEHVLRTFPVVSNSERLLREEEIESQKTTTVRRVARNIALWNYVSN